jgi:hypothetical protein
MRVGKISTEFNRAVERGFTQIVSQIVLRNPSTGEDKVINIPAQQPKGGRGKAHSRS